MKICIGNDSPVRFVDPQGLSWVPPHPKPPPPTPGGHRKNATRAFGMRYFWANCCTPKKDRLSPITGIKTPTKNPLKGVGPSSGYNKTYPYPSTPPGPIGGGGAGTCILLVVKCQGSVSVFHFTAGDAPGATFDQTSWPSGCNAIICGGDGREEQSNCLGDDVMASVKRRGINVVGVSGNSGCGVDANGNWYQYGN